MVVILYQRLDVLNANHPCPIALWIQLMEVIPRELKLGSKLNMLIRFLNTEFVEIFHIVM
jgi:hypothetical protein